MENTTNNKVFMGFIRFRLAEQNDVNNVFSVYNDAIKKMKSQNIYQWDDIYPNKQIVFDDISKQQLYLGLINNEVASVYVLNKDCDKEYSCGKWEFTHLDYCIIHRLCVNPKYQNRGVGRATVQHIETQIKEMGIGSIRLDCFVKNPYAFKLYKSLGYNTVGFADFRMGKFYLMEKRIDTN